MGWLGATATAPWLEAEVGVAERLAGVGDVWDRGLATGLGSNIAVGMKLVCFRVIGGIGDDR